MEKAIISEEISNVTELITKLIKFKNENYLRMYNSGFVLTLKTFRKTGIRYKYRFRNFIIQDRGWISENFPTIKEYKSINRFLHDLKRYRNNLQKKYSEAVSAENE